jgi:RNA recognition motif-containing protein
VGEGKTIFARNVPFDATSESLKEAFKASFGQPVAFAAIVKDHHTGLSKGTAFIKFTVRT